MITTFKAARGFNVYVYVMGDSVQEVNDSIDEMVARIAPVYFPGIDFLAREGKTDEDGKYFGCWYMAQKC